MLVAIYYINLPVTIPDFYTIPAPHLISTTYKGKAIADTL